MRTRPHGRERCCRRPTLRSRPGVTKRAFAQYTEVADRFGKADEPTVQRQVARAFLRKAYRLGELDRHEDAIAVYDEMFVRFRDVRDPRVERSLAQALLNRAIDLTELDRLDAAIAAYDELVARCGDASNPKICENLAWALYNKALLLGMLERLDDAIVAVDDLAARFRDATDDEIRPRVSWGLWKKVHRLEALDRSDEQRPIYAEVVARHDETLDPDLGEIVAWCLWQAVSELGEASDAEGQSAVLDDIVRRFEQSADIELRGSAVTALWRKACELGALGRREEELAIYDDIVSRFGADRAPEVVALVADAIRDKGTALYRMGREDEAFAAYDDSLACIGEADEPLLRAKVAKILLTKGSYLGRANKDAEAVVVFDGVASAYLQVAADPELGPPTLARAFLALLEKVRALDALARPEDAARVHAQLANALGDAPRADVGAAPSGPLETEADLAALLAIVHGGDCWFLQATGGHNRQSQQLMADRAMELYGQTAPILEARSEDWSERAFAASTLLRNVADGYALLSRGWLTKDLAELSLPRRSDAELGIHLLGLDEWAAELGHPISLRDSADDAEESLRQRRDATSDAGEDAVERMPPFLESVRQHELFSALCTSSKSDGVLPNDEVRAFAAWRISEARKWVGWMAARDPEGAGVAAAMLLMEQGCFAAACTPSPSADVFPSAALMRDMLGESDSYRWLADREIELPDWLQAEED
jgi:tetratricopeptide (TPR) repeat protein